jgi:NAD(P)-dependent dehydrogenase (short-subunit alcohol dehydrogenase family)
MRTSSLASRVALITGSSQGIGKALARELGQQGVHVVLNGRRPGLLAQTESELAAEGLSVAALAGDISDPACAQALVAFAVERFGKLDILVNNAGAANRGAIGEVPADSVRTLVEVNLLGTIFPTQAALPQLRQQQGTVLFISSLAGLHGLPYNGLYSSTKQALTALSESLRIEESPHHVHVGIAYVGFTANDPRKVILDTDGQPVYLPPRDGMRLQAPEQVARTLRRMIERRRKRKVLTAVGLGLYWAQRIAPRLIDWVLTRNRRKVQAQSSAQAQPAAQAWRPGNGADQS